VYLQQLARGEAQYVGIPVFPYRAFFLGNVVVNVGAGIERPEDLNGKRVGTTGFHLAGTLWLRGILEEHFGVRGASIHWFTSGQPRVKLPPEMRVEVIPPDRSLSAMLEAGEIDAWLGSSRPECFEHGAPTVRRLFPDYRAVEQEYARRTGHFPILHVVLLRRELYERDRWLARGLYDLFTQARQVGLARLAPDGVPSCGLPWLAADLEELPRLFGGDWYRYGLAANRDVLATMARYMAAQGLTPEAVEVDRLFAEETLDT
jgi:4,5-dihydroxyphthalate decarboxylase